MKIHKEHFEIPEILHRWKMPKGDLIYLVETDQLRISVRIVNSTVRFEDDQPTDKSMSYFSEGWSRKYTGLLDLWPDDACLVLLKGQNLIGSYRRPHFGCSDAVAGFFDKKITFSELLVRRDERDRFEAEKGFVYEAPDQSRPVIEASPDFRQVRFEGKEER